MRILLFTQFRGGDSDLDGARLVNARNPCEFKHRAIIFAFPHELHDNFSSPLRSLAKGADFEIGRKCERCASSIRERDFAVFIADPEFSHD